MYVCVIYAVLLANKLVPLNADADRKTSSFTSRKKMLAFWPLACDITPAWSRGYLSYFLKTEDCLDNIPNSYWFLP